VFDPPPSEGLTDVYDFHVLETGDLDLGPLRLRVAHLPHPVESLGVRIEADGRTLCYSADSGASDTLVDLARDADLFLCEASYLDDNNPLGIHLSGQQAGQHATEANARHLLLTHVPPWTDEDDVLTQARAVYTGPITAARSGITLEV
jgi:ribonuclease BN (tRNA processing enzyme)